jgi:hypothetical protein
MKRNTLQSMVVAAIIAGALLTRNVTPVAAITYKCQHAGRTYELGETRPAVGPLGGYFQCQLFGLTQPGGFIYADWVWHPPS